MDEKENWEVGDRVKENWVDELINAQLPSPFTYFCP